MTSTTSTTRLGGIPALMIEDEERPSIQDFGYAETIFTRQFSFLPRFLRRRR